METLTERQRAVLNYIRQYQRETGFPPTSREIQRHFHFQSQTAAMNHLRALERKGVISRSPHKARGLSDPEMRMRSEQRMVSLLGAIPAGHATDSAATEETKFAVDSKFFGVNEASEVFALKVRGESMIGAQILDGDTVLLKRAMPHEGDIVAALIDSEVTLKRYQLKRGKPFLKAENPSYPDLIPAAELVIQGVMIGLIRRSR
ncbi:MAG: transcriptional repressor LexA [Chthoniobacterales bacterium]